MKSSYPTPNLRLLSILGILAAGIGLALFPVILHAQAGNGITRPEPGDTLLGVVIVEGTAVDPSFMRYEVAFRRESASAGDWIVFAQGDQPVQGGTLAVWDTTIGGEANPVFPDDRYQLRLRVVRLDFNYDEFYVRDLTVANQSATPTVTATLTATLESGPEVTAVAGTVSAPTGPVVLPSLTPFPTPSPPSTPASAALGAARTDQVATDSQGLAEQIGSVDVGQFARAFWAGATVVGYAFLVLGTYLALRAVARWLRRRWRVGRLE